jgi:flagellar biogenesis protein FliO
MILRKPTLRAEREEFNRKARMLFRLAILILVLEFAAGNVLGQESQRRSGYGSSPSRVIQSAVLTDEPAPVMEAEAAPEAAVAAEPPRAPEAEAPLQTGTTENARPSSLLRLAPREKRSSKDLARPPATSPSNAITTVVGSLGIVLGLFVVLVWFSRKFAPAGAAVLPREAVELLGRTSLGGNQQMQLVRVGAKLLLVALSPQGARTLTEINSAAEVERLSELCRRQKPDSATASFRSLVDQMGGERTSSSFVDHNRRTPAAATATSRTRATARA